MLMIVMMLGVSVAWAQYYPGITTLFFRDQGYVTLANGSIGYANVHYDKLLPYYDYPLEYPWLSGVLMLAVNLMGYAFRAPLVSLQAVLVGSSLMMGAAAAAVVAVWTNARVPAYKAFLLFAISPLVLDMFDINFDMAAALFLLLSVYLLARGRETGSSVALALSAAIKGFPLIALPLMAWYAKKGRWRYFARTSGVFGVGMAIQYLISPDNFLRAGSYLSAYGIEGSWLGAVFRGNIIDYETFSTWSSWIPTGSTVIHLPQPYQLVSVGLLCACLGLVWRNRERLAPKTAVFLLMCSVVLFFWWSPPQFLYYPLVLLPLVAPRFLPALLMVGGWEVFGTDPLWIRIPTTVVNFSSPDWLYLSVGYQVCTAAYLAYELRRGGFWLRPKVAPSGHPPLAPNVGVS